MARYLKAPLPHETTCTRMVTPGTRLPHNGAHTKTVPDTVFIRNGVRNRFGADRPVFPHRTRWVSYQLL